LSGSSTGRLPDFIGVGQPRTGTSWLDAVLRGHVGLPREIKEVDFFVKNYARGLDWYKGYFTDCNPRLPVGEICPSYLGSDAARDYLSLDGLGFRAEAARLETPPTRPPAIAGLITVGDQELATGTLQGVRR
jgi:hypothetical protein